MTAPFLAEPRLVLAAGTVLPASFPDRVAAAATAGFASIGLSIRNYRTLRADGWTDGELAAVLRDHGVTIDELEVLTGFHAESGPAAVPGRPDLVYADPEAERLAWHLADRFEVPHVQAIGTFDHRQLGPDVADAFGALCDRAAPHGVAVALEFVPYTSIPDLATASRVVAEAGRDNGGLCVDTWHFFRGVADFDLLSAVPAEWVRMVQVSDGPAVPDSPDLMSDAVHRRSCPGEGELDLTAFLRALDRPGVAASISVEVYADALHRLPAAEAARRALRATERVLATVPTGAGPR
jgi:sugar phosphate isomerase/epimerase